MEDKSDLQKEIDRLESLMNEPGFWNDKNSAQSMIKQIAIKKDEILGQKKYDKFGCILSILSGAGGDDAEDFSFMLFRMYTKYLDKKGLDWSLVHENKNDNNGYRNVSIEITSKGSYGLLKNESGVHRLVRLSPFNSKSLRHTSFSLVEIVPSFDKNIDTLKIIPEDLKIEFSKSGGPGGQNVNKRETAVRIVHLPTNISAHVTSERSQEQNREKALLIIKGKLYKKIEEDKELEKRGLSISKNTEIEWGNQIRSYVLHPYKLVKDNRTKVETNNVDSVLLDGNIDEFIEAEANI